MSGPEAGRGRPGTVEIVLDCRAPHELAAFWRSALDYREHYRDATLVVLVPREGNGPPLLLQAVPEPKRAKNRMHLDVVARDVEAEVRRLEALGARCLDPEVREFGGTRWLTMADPEDNEFCVSTGVDW